jgi:DNA end-binding protein Ku
LPDRTLHRDVRSGARHLQADQQEDRQPPPPATDRRGDRRADRSRRRGYEVDKGVYLKVEDEEIDAIAIESSHTIDIDSFVPKAKIDERYIESPYYLIPENKVALEAFAVIRDAMRGKSMVALGRVVLSKRERVITLQPWGKGLLGTTLRYPYEVRDEEIYFDAIGEVKIPKDMLVLAEHILDTKAARFDATEFHDRYEEAIVAMLNEKKAGLPVTKQREVPRIVAGTDLMAALRQSIEKAKEAAPKPTLASKPAVAPKANKAVKRNPDQREILLPIAGGGPVKEAAEKQPPRASARKKAG